MATYNNTKKVYYTITRGKFNRREEDGSISEFTGIDGFLQNITERKREIEGVEHTFADFHFVDGDENFVVSCEKFGSNFNTIVRCLSNVKDFGRKIKFEVWQTAKDGKTYTNIAVKQGEERIPWCDIPAIETYTIETGETVKSAKKREGFLDKLVGEIRAKLSGASQANSPASVSDPEPQEDGPEIPSYEPHVVEGTVFEQK